LWRYANFQIVRAWTLANYTDAIASGPYRNLLRNTLAIALAAGTASVVVAYTFAHVVRFHLKRWQEPLIFAVVVALFSGYLVRIYAWRTILGDRGVVNEALQGLGIAQEPITVLLYSRFAAILVLCNFLIPLAVLPIYAALQDIREEEVEAARDLGATPWRAFRSVTLPLAWNGVTVAFALVFIIAAGDYVTPQLVGGTSGTMIGQAIARAFNLTFNWPQGAALSFLLLGVVLAIVALVRVVTSRVVLK
jgi:spermidine/putrescine transport system permease protein